MLYPGKAGVGVGGGLTSGECLNKRDLRRDLPDGRARLVHVWSKRLQRTPRVVSLPLNGWGVSVPWPTLSGFEVRSPKIKVPSGPRLF